jgi:ubiquitin C-terminal hydrolase
VLLEQHLSLAGYSEKGGDYQLVAVLLHFGDGFSGHYVAVALDSAMGQWVYYNDDMVRLATPDDIDSPMAYMCFYRHKTIPMPLSYLSI